MKMSSSHQSVERARHTRRLPDQSFFYERLVPILLVILGLVMAGLIIVAAGVLLGLVQYR
jgi:hypothetical protein